MEDSWVITGFLWGSLFFSDTFLAHTSNFSNWLSRAASSVSYLSILDRNPSIVFIKWSYLWSRESSLLLTCANWSETLSNWLETWPMKSFMMSITSLMSFLVALSFMQILYHLEVCESGVRILFISAKHKNSNFYFWTSIVSVKYSTKSYFGVLNY